MKRQINIIPADYQGNPQDALGYGWTVYVSEREAWTDEQKAADPWGGCNADRSKSVPGDDRTGEYGTFLAVKAELEAEGLVCINPKDEIVPDGAIIEARVDCMWCGGASLLAYRLPAGADAPDQKNPAPSNPGEESLETAVLVAMDEHLYEMELDEQYKNHPGWCTRCHSFCYGDCQAYKG